VKKKVNISIVLPNLLAGGAERVVSYVAQELNKTKFNATLIIIGHEKDAAYEIKGIDILYFEKSRVLTGIPKLFVHLLKNKPDIVFSAVGHLNTVTAYMSILFPNIKFVGREVNVLSVLKTFGERKFNPFSSLSKRRFNYLDKIICQSQDMLNDLNNHFSIDQSKLVVINNPITKGFSVKPKEVIKQKLQFITVARLKKQKGHERILIALNKLDIPFHYTIIGNGPEKDYLFNLINEFGYSDSVTHIPYTKEVAKFLSQSDIYLQGSYVEGFPNALIESCAVGTPVVAFKAPGGLNEIIIEGINGHISEHETEFLTNIKQLFNNELIDPKVVSESVYRRYAKNIIMQKYEDTFINLIKRNAKD
jgi:glycosyltransferase involved in cell wall biosynthesis